MKYYVSKMDAIVILACYTPVSLLAYACSYIMLAQMHPDDLHEYATFAMYGCMQCIFGFTSGYYTAKWIYFRHKPERHSSMQSKLRPVEETPQLAIAPTEPITPPPPVADTGEASTA